MTQITSEASTFYLFLHMPAKNEHVQSSSITKCKDRVEKKRKKEVGEAFEWNKIEQCHRLETFFTPFSSFVCRLLKGKFKLCVRVTDNCQQKTLFHVEHVKVLTFQFYVRWRNKHNDTWLSNLRFEWFWKVRMMRHYRAEEIWDLS